MMEEIIQAIKQTKSEIGNKEVECEWKEYKIEDVFECKTTKTRELTKYIETGKIPFVSGISNNNGVEKFVNTNEELEKGNCVSVSSLDCSAFYQKHDFIGRGHGVVQRLYNKNMNEKSALFICSLIKELKYKYSYENQCFLTALKQETIQLPTKNNQPDFEMMEKIIVDLKNQSKLNKINEVKAKLKNDIRELDTSNWEEVILTNEGVGKEIILKLKKGNINLVSSTENNNGVSKKVSGYKKLFEGNKLTLAKNGSVGCVFYQAEPFCATSDVVVLSHPKLTKNSALFIKTILEKQTKNFDYNNKINNKNLNKITLKLPSFEFMEKFMEEIKL